jgi:hypothetical protein
VIDFRNVFAFDEIACRDNPTIDSLNNAADFSNADWTERSNGKDFVKDDCFEVIPLNDRVELAFLIPLKDFDE